MVNAHIDISQRLDGEPVVLACFDLGEEQLRLRVRRRRGAEPFRTSELSTDDVIELRELTALCDELADLALRPGMRTVVIRPARLTIFRDAVARFIESRDEAEWVREEDREPLARVRALLYPLEDLCGDALHAALGSATAPRTH